MKTSQWSHGRGEGQGVLVPPPCATAIRTTRHCKPSYVVNREEKERLREELRYLEARVALLGHETGMVLPQVLESKRALGAELRNATLLQNHQFASMQSMLSGFTNSRVTSPLEAYIHLTTDWQQRRDVLLAMRNRKIDVARLFLHERTRFIDPFQECSELSRFITPEGDFCTIKMDVVPFEGVKSVRQVFDAMHFYLTNLEIAMTEMSGNVTVLENDENTEATVLHYRLATAERGDILVENSCVIFLDTSGLDCDNANHQNVVITADFVDRDDLFPYRPIQRLRKESTSVMKLSACRRKHVGVVPASGDSKSMEKEDELVVVLTRWFFVRMRRPEMAVPEPVLRNITDNLTVCSDDMIHYIREGLHPSSTIEQSESSLVGPEFGQKL